MISNDGCIAKINEVHKAPHGQPLHHVSVEKGSLRVHDRLQLKVDAVKRAQTTANHSCTCLLYTSFPTKPSLRGCEEKEEDRIRGHGKRTKN